MATYRAKVVSFDSGTWTATVRLDGSAASTLEDVATARNIAAAEMTSGRNLLIDTGDHNHPSDFVVFAVWG